MAKKWGYKKNSVVYGTKQDTRIQCGNSDVDIFVFRVSMKIGDKKIKEYLTDESINVVSIEQASDDKVSQFRSFHVVIPRSDIDTVMDLEFWPVGVGCRLWGEKQRKQNGGQHQNWSSRHNRT